GDWLQSHVLRGFRGERRAHAARAMEDEFLVLLEDRLGVGTRRVDPELEHAAGAGEGAGNLAVALDLAGIADVDDDDAVVGGELDRVRRTDGFDLGIGLVDQRLDAAVDGLGHGLSLCFMGAPWRRASDALSAPVPSSRLRGPRS